MIGISVASGCRTAMSAWRRSWINKVLKSLTIRSLKKKFFNIIIYVCFVLKLKLNRFKNIFAFRKFLRKFTVLKSPFKFKKSFEYFGLKYFQGSSCLVFSFLVGSLYSEFLSKLLHFLIYFGRLGAFSVKFIGSVI